MQAKLRAGAASGSAKPFTKSRTAAVRVRCAADPLLLRVARGEGEICSTATCCPLGCKVA